MKLLISTLTVLVALIVALPTGAGVGEPLEDGGGGNTLFCYSGRYEQLAYMDGPLGFRIRVCRQGVTLIYPAPGWYTNFYGNIDGCVYPNVLYCDRWRPWPAE